MHLAEMLYQGIVSLQKHDLLQNKSLLMLQGYVPLHHAAATNNIAIAKLLLSFQANPDAQDIQASGSLFVIGPVYWGCKACCHIPHCIMQCKSA